jgi:hypothetical protein
MLWSHRDSQLGRQAPAKDRTVPAQVGACPAGEVAAGPRPAPVRRGGEDHPTLVKWKGGRRHESARIRDGPCPAPFLLDPALHPAVHPAISEKLPFACRCCP